MKSILMLLALAFLVFQIQAEPELEQGTEPLDISDENDSHVSEEKEETPLGFMIENETIEPEENSPDDSQEGDAIIQSRSTKICNEAGATCRSRCLSRETSIGNCRKNVRCCMRYR